MELEAPSTVHAPLPKKKRKEGASKSFLPGRAGSALSPHRSSGNPGRLAARARRLQPAQEADPRPKEPAAGSAAPFCPPGLPGADAGTSGSRSPGKARSGPAGIRRRWKKGRRAAAETSAAHRGRPLPVSAPPARTAPGSDWGRGRGRGVPGHLHPQAPARRADTSHPPSPPAGHARRGRALGPGAAHRPPPPPTRRPGFSCWPLSPATFRALFYGWK